MSEYAFYVHECTKERLQEYLICSHHDQYIRGASR